MIEMSSQQYKIYLLLNLINHHKSVSRTRLGEMTEYRPGTISELVKRLLERGLIVEKGHVSGGRGRNQVLLEMNNSHLCAIGVSIEPHEIMYILSTFNGDILETVRQAIPNNSAPSRVVEMVVTRIRQLTQRHSDRRILGVGIGDPGIVHSRDGYSIFSSQLSNWKNVRLRSLVSSATALPVRVGGNEQLKALGEKRFGLALGCGDFVCVQLGEGIGMSIVANNSLVKGAIGAAGELGHTLAGDGDRLCACGSFGCLEASASLRAIKDQLRDALARGVASELNSMLADTGEIGVKDIRLAMDSGDSLCINVVSRAAGHIGLALSNVVNLLNPELVIFEGEMIELGDALFDTIRSRVAQNTLAAINKGLEFKVSKLKEYAAPLGAVTMIFESFLRADIFENVYGRAGQEPLGDTPEFE